MSRPAASQAPRPLAFLLRILCQRGRRWVWFPVVAVAASRAADSRCGRCPLRRMLGSTRDFLGSCVVFLLRFQHISPSPTPSMPGIQSFAKTMASAPWLPRIASACPASKNSICLQLSING